MSREDKACASVFVEPQRQNELRCCQAVRLLYRKRSYWKRKQIHRAYAVKAVRGMVVSNQCKQYLEIEVCKIQRNLWQNHSKVQANRSGTIEGEVKGANSQISNPESVRIRACSQLISFYDIGHWFSWIGEKDSNLSNIPVKTISCVSYVGLPSGTATYWYNWITYSTEPVPDIVVFRYFVWIIWYSWDSVARPLWFIALVAIPKGINRGQQKPISSVLWSLPRRLSCSPA